MKPARCLQPTSPTHIPLFLAPAFADLGLSSHGTVRSFTSTTCNQTRKKVRDLNRRRGESVIRSTGPRHMLNVQRKFKELPKPRPEEDRPLDAFPTNPNHGLYGFFNKDKETVVPPEREELHGRAWAYHELVFKRFEDLHTLYWQGIMEMNRIRTRAVEHQRLKLGYGATEIKERRETVRETLRNIRRVLRDRQDAYEEAKLIKEREGSMDNLQLWLEQQEQKANELAAVTAAPRIEILSEPEAREPSQAVEGASGEGEVPQPPKLGPRPTH